MRLKDAKNKRHYNYWTIINKFSAQNLVVHFEPGLTSKQ